MRTLIITRGAPGSGKSTWIKRNNLEKYTICPDDLRVLCGSRELFADGHVAIPCNRATEDATWKVLFNILEYRMSRGELTVIDATASKTADILRYSSLADQYRYRIYCVDFTGVPLETCLAQNKMRPEDKWVPEAAIKNIYARFATQGIPSGVVRILPDELDKVFQQPLDMSSYKKIVFIGDIHGCYDTLMQYEDFKTGLKDDTAYIFAGDYLDRGNQNAEVFKYLFSIMDKPNVCLLEGNHEAHIRAYGMSAPAKSREFEQKTRVQLACAGITDKEARMMGRKFRQMSYITFGDKEIFVCHGGVPNLMTNPVFISTHAMIHGVGEYKDYAEVANNWATTMKENKYMVFGHRNVYDDPIEIADRVFNLEGKVEFGGNLRLVELSADGWKTIELPCIQPETEEETKMLRPVETVEQAVSALRDNKFVAEKTLGGNISAFNFTREAFMKSNWNRQTILARGLFVDTAANKIVARSYEKFFRINEMPATSLAALKDRLVFPVSAYVKENGFLAIISYDEKADDLFVASKSTNTGPFVGYINEAIKPYKSGILNILRRWHIDHVLRNGEPSISLVFECVDPIHDPHIIKYNEGKIVLLDIIYNTLEYKTLPYMAVYQTAKDYIKCPVKEQAYVINTWDEFVALYNDVQDYEYTYKDNYIEGFVFVDQNGFMTKCKTGYYNFWKHMRSVADSTLRCGNYARTGSLLDVMSNKFFGFCKECFKDRDKETKTYPYKTDIISLREKFELNNR